MLRFIKSSDIEITFREKEKWFNPNLLKGLSLALFFHLFLGACFHISSPPNLEKMTFLTPIPVEIDLSLPIYSPPCPVMSSPIDTLEPPQLLDIPAPCFSKQPTRTLKRLPQEPDFSQIEKIPYISTLEKEITKKCSQ